MTKLSVLVLLTVALFHCSVHAETLIAPHFPEKDVWSQATEQPLTGPDGKTVGKIVFYALSSDNANAPKNLFTTTEMNRSPNTSPDNYVNNHARGLQQHCESLQLSRPTHLLEKSVPVSYARIYCAKLKGEDGGLIQTVKALQGADKLFMVVREWRTPSFTFNVPLKDREKFAKSVFGSGDAALAWVGQMDAANNHLEQAVTLCSSKTGEFGEPCVAK